VDLLQITKTALSSLTPEILLLAGGTLIMCGSLLPPVSSDVNSASARSRFGLLSIFLLLLAGALSFWRGTPVALDPQSGLFRFDQYFVTVEKLTLLGALPILLMSWSSAPQHKLAEYYGCLLFIFAAIPFVAAANDLIGLFLCLELVSIPTYILLGVVKTDGLGMEACLKYFLLSAFSSGFFLFGLSYLYGSAGSTNLSVIQNGFANNQPLLSLGLILAMCGLSFRITAVPFHFYAPDVFAGTSLTVAGALSYLPKLAGFTALLRLLGTALNGSPTGEVVIPLLWVAAAVTMCVGNSLAVIQQNLRRILAYSSVAHTGYLLLGLAALLRQGLGPEVIFSYLAAYAVMTLGLFACLGEIEASSGRLNSVDDLNGAFHRNRLAVLGMTICLLSLIGLPLTAGFWAKFMVFGLLVAVPNPTPFDISMGLLMALNAAVAASYYWRILSAIYSLEGGIAGQTKFEFSFFLAYAFCAILTLVWFFVPSLM